MLKWLSIAALAAAAFVAFMTTGSGRAAEQGAAAAKDVAPAKESAKEAEKSATKETGAKAAAEAPAKKTDKDVKDKTDVAVVKDKTDKDAKPDGTTKSPADKTASAAGAAGPRKAKGKRKRDGSKDDEAELPPGQGPPPPSPLTVDDLRQETSRERGPGGDFNAPPRVKLEQLLSEVSKARQSLHDDTLKLEALSGNDSHGAGTAGASDPAQAPSATAQPPQKNPLEVLAKALRGIKPEQAGPIVARLDKGLAATVLLKMPPADAGKIMGALKPEVAAELATQIAMRAPSSQPGGKR